MPNKRYIAGRRFEYMVKQYYESLGCYCIRSAGSHSVADIVVYADNSKYIDSIDVPSNHFLVQCKKDGKLSTKERNKCIKWSKIYGYHIVLAWQDKEKGLCIKLIW